MSNSRSLKGRKFGKIGALFRCSNQECGKVWKSIHAWKQVVFFCDVCDSNAKVIKVRDEYADVDAFHCNCNRSWVKLHDRHDIARECSCGQLSFRRGTQRRFGRHYWLNCQNNNFQACEREWEEFNVDLEFKQRCTKCNCTGNVLKLLKNKRRQPLPNHRDQSQVKKKELPDNANNDQGHRGDDDGTHLATHCDMCQHLRATGSHNSCANVYSVII